MILDRFPSGNCQSCLLDVHSQIFCANGLYVCANGSIVQRANRRGHSKSKYPPAEPGALVLEPLKAACPCRFSSAPLHSKECLTSVCRNNPRKFLAPTLRSSHHFL